MFCNYDNRKMWKRVKAACRPSKKKEVERVSSDSSEEIELNVHYQDSFYQRPAGKHFHFYASALYSGGIMFWACPFV